jgi:pyruvate/2-oxoglutarate dehydrogenase complex dihydrolipoamide acyltransferase (E2) component
MALPVHVPRVNNNDDEVKLIALDVAVGDAVQSGQVIAQVETDKAIVDVEASGAGFVLAIRATVDEVVGVGSVLMWLGATADETPPAEKVAAGIADGGARPPTTKALALLREHGLDAADVAASGDRLSVADIDAHLAKAAGAKRKAAAAPATAAAAARPPEVDGAKRDLSSGERGMLATVTWHRDVAVAGYIEIEYDTAAWEEHAKNFAETNKLLFSPLLSLMTHRLVRLAVESPILNATIVGHQRHEYTPVNIGFTVQAGDTLYLAVTRDAQAMGDLQFVNAMLDLQKRATLHKLGPAETSGATIGFSSMARWKVSRHMPILPPNTAFMVAHTAVSTDKAVLGATYDHRVMNGFHVVAALRKLAKP